MEQFVNLCIIQHVHDNDLKGLFHDYECLLSVSRLEDADEESREIVECLTILSVLMPYDMEQQMILKSLGVKYNRHWKYIPEYRSFLQSFERDELLEWPLNTLNTIKNQSLLR